MTKTAISIYRGLKEKFNPETHIGFYITTDTNELLIGNSSLGKAITSGEVPVDYPNYIKLNLNSGDSIYVKIPDASDENPGFMSKEQAQQLQLLLENTFAYGVEFSNNGQIDSKLDIVGNTNLYNQLPIQNKMKGCITASGVFRYYLDPNDWRFIEGTDNDFTGGTLKYNVSESESGELIHDQFKFECDKFNNLRFEQSYIKIKGDVEFIAFIKSINTATKTADLVVRDELIPVTETSPGTVIKNNISYTLGACRNGYDGTVRVHVPKFYIRQSVNPTNGRTRVLISEMNLGEDWKECPSMYVDAYNATILRTVPSEYLHLSNLEAGAAISVDNAKDYCRGANNDATTDSNYVMETKSGNSDLNLSAYNLTRAQCREAASKANSELLTYEQYSHLYWLYVIEQANFNTQLEGNYDVLQLGDKDYSAGLPYIVKVSDSSAGASCGFSTQDGSARPCGCLDRIGNYSGYGTISYNEEEYTFCKWRGFELFNWPMIVDSNIVKHTPSEKASKLYINTSDDSTGGDAVEYDITKNRGWVDSFVQTNEVLIAPSNIEQSPLSGKYMYYYTPTAAGTYQINVNHTNRFGSQILRELTSTGEPTHLFFRTVNYV